MEEPARADCLLHKTHYPKRPCGPFTSLRFGCWLPIMRAYVIGEGPPRPPNLWLRASNGARDPAPAVALDCRAAAEHAARSGRRALSRNARQSGKLKAPLSLADTIPQRSSPSRVRCAASRPGPLRAAARSLPDMRERGLLDRGRPGVHSDLSLQPLTLPLCPCAAGLHSEYQNLPEANEFVFSSPFYGRNGFGFSNRL